MRHCSGDEKGAPEAPRGESVPAKAGGYVVGLLTKTELANREREALVAKDAALTGVISDSTNVVDLGVADRLECVLRVAGASSRAAHQEDLAVLDDSSVMSNN